MKPGKVRPLALCVFRHNGCILVAEGYDKVKEEQYYRPLGGGIEFGEIGAQTVVRELREEIDAEVTNVAYLGTLESIFIHNGKMGHEFLLIYDGTLADATLYDQVTIEGCEGEVSATFRACWKSLDEFRQEGAPPLYPTGLLELLS
ncbi:MAG TPA: NUDIX domain-containing protein [Phototrophicaceae bacterium]|nr:NUDIX domain-containing protein [Phototrophicaceae bacterium]